MTRHFKDEQLDKNALEAFKLMAAGRTVCTQERMLPDGTIHRKMCYTVCTCSLTTALEV